MATADRATVRSAYLYLVCLVTLVRAIFAAVSIVRSVSQLAYPDPGYYGIEAPAREGGVTEEDVARREDRAARVAAPPGRAEHRRFRRDAAHLRPVYLYHWRRVQEETSTARSDLRAPVP